MTTPHSPAVVEVGTWFGMEGTALTCTLSLGIKYPDHPERYSLVARSDDGKESVVSMGIGSYKPGLTVNAASHATYNDLTYHHTSYYAEMIGDGLVAAGNWEPSAGQDTAYVQVSSGLVLAPQAPPAHGERFYASTYTIAGKLQFLYTDGPTKTGLEVTFERVTLRGAGLVGAW